MDTSKHERFSTVTIMRIFCSVLEAIVYLHSQSPPIIHRDIKVRRPTAASCAITVPHGSPASLPAEACPWVASRKTS